MKLRQIKLITDNLTRIENGARKNIGTLSYGQILIDILSSSPSAEGLDIGAIRKRVKLIDKIEDCVNSGKDLLLSDEEYLFITQNVTNYRFRIADSAIVRFIDAVENAPSVSVATQT